MQALWPYIWTLLGIIVTFVAGKYFSGKTNHDRILAFDKIADDMLAAIRLNNPGNVLLEKVQFYEDKLVAALLAAPQVTNNSVVVSRLAAGAISRAIVNDGAVVDEAAKRKATPKP